MIILGFDLSTKYIGWAVTDGDGQRIESGEVKLIGEDFESRFENAIDKIDHLIYAQHDPAVVVEAPFCGRNGKTSMQLGKLCGMLRGITAISKGTRVAEISPAEVKRAMTGKGNADKSLMMQMARARYGLNEVGEHEADALGVCLAATMLVRMKDFNGLAHSDEDGS